MVNNYHTIGRITQVRKTCSSCRLSNQYIRLYMIRFLSIVVVQAENEPYVYETVL